MMVEVPFGEDTKSNFEEMPVHKAFNNYLRVVNEGLIPRQGLNLNAQHGHKDEFPFPFSTSKRIRFELSMPFSYIMHFTDQPLFLNERSLFLTSFSATMRNLAK